LFIVSPVGPAIPVIANPRSEPASRRTPCAIARTAGALTAPDRLKSSAGTFSSRSFIAL